MFGQSQLVHENQGVTCTAQDQDYRVMSENECHDLLYEKLYYIIHRNNKVTAGEHQYHSNTLPDQ